MVNEVCVIRLISSYKASKNGAGGAPRAGSAGNKPYFHEGEFDRVGRGEVDIQYVSKDGCRFLGLWPFRGQPAVVCRSKEVCGLEAGRTVP